MSPLAKTRHFKGLRLGSAFLRGIKGVDEGLVVLGDMTGLRWLDLEGSDVTDEGLKQLIGLKDLSHLDLTQTQVTDAGIAELKEALPKCRIVGP